jgi:hypothetical protein
VGEEYEGLSSKVGARKAGSLRAESGQKETTIGIGETERRKVLIYIRRRMFSDNVWSCGCDNNAIVYLVVRRGFVRGTIESDIVTVMTSK